MPLLTPAQVRAGKKRDYRVDRAKLVTLYFVGCAKNPVHMKIGVTTNLDVRMNRMQSANPFLLKPHWAFTAHIDVERAIHEKLTEYHFRGEWFLNEDGSVWAFGRNLFKRVSGRLYRTAKMPEDTDLACDPEFFWSRYWSHQLTLKDVEACEPEPLE
ncbi:GIY-YIG nuclease family protein [Pelagibacterium luteolum]|uniref:T5orf172 domain-containing protein n=1 Tax=Pelagibacterium luteolum TaxID=440168 RepID=A0A1G7TJY2_9HYPH|nr:GIY-YIG nuclease family protein [Pelagibacterium luteolum]SDG35637.1 T5orf172 domain-containing protein [Pelagibacterium luteolum]